jgi:hypothetical protein
MGAIFNIGLIYYDDNNYEDALYYFLQYLIKRFDPFCLYYIAQCYRNSKNMIDYRRYLSTSYKLFVSDKNEKQLTQKFANKLDMMEIMGINGRQIIKEKKIIKKVLNTRLIRQLIDIVFEYYVI